MEKDQNRDEFLDTFDSFCHFVELNGKFMNSLKNCRSFSRNMITVERITDVYAQKIFIFLEFTRLRSTCDMIIEFLNDSESEKNFKAAEYLKNCNTTKGLLKFDSVVLAKAPMKGSLIYNMSKNPRGKCVIINNFVTKDKNLEYESIRFESIFKQLYFEVECAKNLSTEQIRKGLKNLSENPNLDKSDALIVMIITHGEDEKILGLNGNDSMHISEVINTFSEDNCPSLSRVPKVFFFNCCRIKTSSQSANDNNLHQEKLSKIQPIVTSDKIPLKKNMFICYSCAEGELSWNTAERMSIFGEALSYSICQYSAQECLNDILTRTCKLIDDLLPEYQHLKSRPEIRGLCPDRKLYFNPGFCEQN